MPSILESAQDNGFLNPTLKAGLELIDQDATLVFTRYAQFTSPIDGFIYWLKTSETQLAKGSLHYSTDSIQESDEVFDQNSILFTSETNIDDFNVIGSESLWIATYQLMKFAFSSRSALFAEAGLYHYSGDALYPALETQLIESPESFDYQTVIVSNSMAIWLDLNTPIKVYPAYLSVQNKDPIYATVEVMPNSQMALQNTPLIDEYGKHWQLISERVKFIIYGTRNQAALEFQDYILAAPPWDGSWGIMDSPIMKDEIRTQPEITAIAMKKSFELQVNYYQQNVIHIARRLIKNAYLAAINNIPLSDPHLIP
jgi:hypothetical protein